MQFTPEHKEEINFERKPRFKPGVHKVKILTFEAGKTKEGKEYVEAFFTSQDGVIEDSARVWFTTDKAVRYSFNVLKSILTHNTPENEREVVKTTIDKVGNPTEFVNLLNSKLVGKEMWFSVAPDPHRTYMYEGRTYQSLNKNIYGWEPEPPKTLEEEVEDVFSTKASGTSSEGWL